MNARQSAAFGVHLLTASGIVFLLLALREIIRLDTRPALVFVWFIAATIVDAIDGPLARKFEVKRYAPDIDGRTIDDIVDYIGFTLLPLLLAWDMKWLPGLGFGFVLISIGAMTSLLGFAHQHAKDEAGGFFRGFPSYWNLVVFYLGISAALLPTVGPWINAVVVLGLSVLTVLPVWFIYPNLAPPRLKPAILFGSYAWALLLVMMLPFYPAVPTWLVLISLVYPAFYIVASVNERHRWPAST